jgi:hypothetical protein
MRGNIMADYGVLSAMRSLIAEDGDIKSKGLSDKIHLAVPPKSDLPLVLLELEEIWTSLRLGSETGHARLKLKASIMNNSVNNREVLSAAESIRQIIDGRTIVLKEGMKATIKLANSIIDLPTNVGPNNVQQYYEVLVRG